MLTAPAQAPSNLSKRLDSVAEVWLVYRVDTYRPWELTGLNRQNRSVVEAEKAASE